MCNRPCWPIPSEIAPIIAAGEGHRLMLDWWVGNFRDDNDEYDGDVYILCPANPGREGQEASSSFWILSEGCAFHTSDGLCQLHDRGLKPLEGRVAHHRQQNSKVNVHELVARAWDTEEGRDVVAQWCSSMGVENPYEL